MAKEVNVALTPSTQTMFSSHESNVSSTFRSITTSSHSAQSNQPFEEEEDYYDKFNTIAGWQMLLLLQFLPQMYIVILMYLYLWYGTAIINVAFSFGCPLEKIPRVLSSAFLGILYVGDVGYFIDWISMVIFKNVKWTDMNIKYRSRHGFILFVELVSLIPYEPIYGVLVEPNMRVYHCLRLRYTLRLIRLYVYFKHSQKHIANYGVFLYIVIYFGILVLVVITTAAVHYVSYCDGQCKYADLEVLSRVIYTTFVKFSFGGVKIETHNYKHPLLDTPFVSLLCYFVIILFVSYFTCDLLQGLWPRFHLTRKYRRCKQRVELWRRTMEWGGYYINFQRLLEEHSEISKTKLKDALTAHQTKILPPILRRDLALDICWVPLKHTHLFANEDVFFLRAIAEKMVHKFLCPGEVVFKKNLNKNVLVYIISGNIDVLSEEDGETPIVTFTSGTCLGESALAIGYPSISTVISKDISNVAVLERRQLAQLAKLYPKQIRKLFNRIMERYEQARVYRSLTEYQYHQSTTSQERIGVLSLKWLKMTLRKLLYDDEETIQDTYSTEVLDDMEKRVFCTRYLDLLVQSEHMGTTANSTFIRTKFPIIFRPSSLLLKIWECGVLVHAFVLAITFPIAFVYLPSLPLMYQVFYVYITCVWIFDVYVQSSTAVYTKFVQCTKVSEIFMYKTVRWSFIVDLFASIPLEFIFYIMNGCLPKEDAIIACSNRLLKLYRLEKFFVDLETTAKGVASILYMKYILYFVMICYYVSACLYILGTLDSNRQMYEEYLSTFSADTTYEQIYYTFILAIAFARDLCLFKFPYSGEFDTTIPLMILMVCVEVFIFFLLAHTIAIETMKRVDEHATDEFLRNMEVTMEVYGLEKALKDRVRNYIDLHMAAMGNLFLFEGGLFKHLPEDLYAISKGIYPGLFIKNLPFFYHLHDRIVNTILASGSTDLVLPRETFKSIDETCPDIYVLMNGFCTLNYVTGEKRTVGPGEVFCILEAAFGIKSLVHITSLTACRILTIRYDVLKSILFRFPKEHYHLEETVKYFPYWEELERISEAYPPPIFMRSVHISTEVRSFKFFRYHRKVRTQLFYEFRAGFPHWAHFLRYLLLRVVFYSGGNFVFYWEFFHSICAVIYALLLYLSLVLDSTHLGWFIARSAFECLGFIDIYLRHHYTYYDENNVEIAHPYKTCIYYWKHAFLVDFIGWLPFEWMVSNPSMSSQLWRLNRLLQLYRVFGFVAYLIEEKTTLRGCWRMLSYTPIIILILNVINYLVVKVFCHRTGSTYQCRPGTWLSSLGTNSAFEIYMYNFLFICVIITGSNNYLVVVNKPIEMHVFLVLISVEFLLYTVFSAKVVAANLAINRDLCGYQEAMQDLVKFLNYLKIDRNLKWETIKHHEYIWSTFKGKHIINTFSVFKSYFKVDVLYNIYGQSLGRSTIFLTPNENFLRCLLLEAKHELYLKTGIIYQVNDISGDIFILVKGKVEIVGADLHRLETLHVGSVFGNLDLVQNGRRTLSAVASGHVEVLKVDSLTFYKYLLKFPKIFKHFRKLTRFHVDYIQDERSVRHTEDFEEYRVPSEVLNILYKQQLKKSCQTRIFKRNILIKIWEEYILNIMYFVQYMVELFNMSSVTPFSIYFVLYLFDIMYVLKVYLRLHTSYEDEYGRTIMLRSMIFKRYKKEKFGLLFDLATLIPFELISFAFISTSYYQLMLAVSRINRLPRILLTLISCKKTTQKLHVHVVWVRFRYLLLWVFLVQYNFTFLLKITDRTHDTVNSGGIVLFLRYMHVVIDASRHVATDLLSIEHNIVRLCMLNVVLIGTTIISFVFMAECCVIILLLMHTSSMYKRFVLCAKRFMEIENVSAPLIERIKNYMDLLWTHQKGVQFPQLLQDSPQYLKEAVLYSMFGNHLMKHPVLMHCHKDLTRQICTHMRTMVFFPGDNVAYTGEIDNCMYFIQEGEVHALSEDTMYSEVVEFTLKGGDMFGLDQGLYPRCGHDHTYNCVAYTIVVVLCRKDWIHLLDFFPASKRMIYDTAKAAEI